MTWKTEGPRRSDGPAGRGHKPAAAPHSRIATARRHDIPVPDGTIACWQMPGRAGALPLLYLPGFGGYMDGFAEVIENVASDVPLYYLETREKASSALRRDAGRLSRRASGTPGGTHRLSAGFAMDDIAADVWAAARALGLEDGGYVLFGSSFGAAVGAHALSLDEAPAPAPPARAPRPALTVLFDPMHELWLPPWLVRAAAATLPLGLVAFLRPSLKRLVLAGMQAEVQRRRAGGVIDNAVLWKWRAAALGLSGWSIFDIAPQVQAPVDIIAASGDRFHAADLYPRIAAAFPRARLVHLEVADDEREQEMGRLASAYARAAGAGFRG